MVDDKTKRNDDKIISALISTATVKQAAAQAGVSVSTIYKRLNDTEFYERYSDARSRILEQCAQALQFATVSAISVMVGIMEDENNAPQVRLNAADAIVRNNLGLTKQHEMHTRLKKLEEWQSENGLS